MARQLETPKEIMTNRIGYPARMENGPRLNRSDKKQLLREYSDKLLGNLEGRLDQSISHWNTIRLGGATLAFTALTALNYVAFLGSYEVRHGVPLDPLASGIIGGYKGIIDILSHAGMTDSLTQFVTATYGLTVGVPLAVSMGANYRTKVLESQQSAVEEEQGRREIEKAVQAALEAERARQETLLQPHLILVSSRE